ncbi:TPA: hypothetical protein ACGO5H_001665 [Streptococcus suis]|nr:hypothetical protein [Streptococcus suis]
MNVDFSELNKLSKSRLNIDKVTVSNPSNGISSLQQKADLNKKKSDFYKKILQESEDIRSQVNQCISNLLEMIENEASINELFSEGFVKLISLSSSPDCLCDVREHLIFLALENDNKIAGTVISDVINLLLHRMRESYNKIDEDIGARMRLESAIKKHEVILTQLK